MIRRELAVFVASMVMLSLAQATLARADEPAAALPADVPTPMTDKPSDKKAATAAPAPTATSSHACAPDYAPVYVEDWGRLAALTQSDPLIFPRAEFWAKRREQANWVLGTGMILGGGAVTLGAVNRLTTGSWSDTTKWSMAGGASLALLSILAEWAFAPDRDDLLTIINQWNLRHRDRLLAP